MRRKLNLNSIFELKKQKTLAETVDDRTTDWGITGKTTGKAGTKVSSPYLFSFLLGALPLQIVDFAVTTQPL